jgi:hypothetical protein
MKVGERVGLVQSLEMGKDSRIMNHLVHHERSSGQGDPPPHADGDKAPRAIARSLEDSEHASNGEIAPNRPASLVGSAERSGRHSKHTVPPPHQRKIVADHLAGSRGGGKRGFPAPRSAEKQKALTLLRQAGGVKQRSSFFDHSPGRADAQVILHAQVAFEFIPTQSEPALA